MTPTEFVLWLNGAVGIMDEPPTEAQWEKIKAQLAESLGELARLKLMEHAEGQMQKLYEAKKQEELIKKLYAGASAMPRVAVGSSQDFKIELGGIPTPKGLAEMLAKAAGSIS